MEAGERRPPESMPSGRWTELSWQNRPAGKIWMLSSSLRHLPYPKLASNLLHNWRWPWFPDHHAPISPVLSTGMCHHAQLMQCWEWNPGLHALGKHCTNWDASPTPLSIFAFIGLVSTKGKNSGTTGLIWVCMAYRCASVCVCLCSDITSVFDAFPNSTRLLGSRRCKRQS